MTDRISESDLRAEVLRAEHRDVSPSQLKRLRREGLLQRPTQRHAIGVAGSETLYPPEALDQLLGVVHIRDHRRQRPFDAVRFLAWEEGLWVDHHSLRNTLARLVRDSAVVTQGLGGTGDPQDHADARARKLAEADRDRRLVSRLSAQGLDPASFAFAAIQIAEGMEDAALGAQLIGDETGFSELAARYGSEMTLFDAIQQYDLPSASQWPRLVSRTSKKHVAIAHGFLTSLKQLTELLPPPLPTLLGLPDMSDDSDKGIGNRAAQAAVGIFLSPSFVEDFRALVALQKG